MKKMPTYLTIVYIRLYKASSWSWSYGSWICNCLCNEWLSPLMLPVRIPNRPRCTTLCDKVYQWLPTGRWFSPFPPVSSANKAEILLKVALRTIKPKLKAYINKIHCIKYFSYVLFKLSLDNNCFCSFFFSLLQKMIKQHILHSVHFLVQLL
jgi:hypothetical protein